MTDQFLDAAIYHPGREITLIGEAVMARCLSAAKDERVAASKILSGPGGKFTGDKKAFVEDIFIV